MSDNWIKIIPENYNFVLDPKHCQQAINLFWRMAPNSEEIVSQTTKYIQFHDCGQNDQIIYCPNCDKEIELDWWLDWMNRDYSANGFQLTNRVLPCCRYKADLHQLRYFFPQGFGQFCITAKNPNISKLSAEQINQFEVIFNGKIRVIDQHL